MKPVFASIALVFVGCASVDSRFTVPPGNSTIIDVHRDGDDRVMVIYPDKSALFCNPVREMCRLVVPDKDEEMEIPTHADGKNTRR